MAGVFNPSWKELFAALSLSASVAFVWQPSAAGLAQSRLVEGQQSSKTFYHLKASYTYTGKNGPEPLEFDVVVGCALELTKYITGDVSGRSSRVPTMVAYEMSDGGAIGIAIPKACRGSTTSNGEVPSDFLPATIQYEDAKDLSLGMLYASEDAYDSPLAKLKFHGASIERATERDFEDFIASDRFENNLISVESSKDFGASNIPITDEMRENPKQLWKHSMPRECHGMARVKMPKNVREYLKQFWKPSDPRYWMVSVEHSRHMKSWLSRRGGTLPSPISPPKVTINFSSFQKYDIVIEHTGGGIVTRRGGGNMASHYNPKTGATNYLPPDYFPFAMISAAPWLEATPSRAYANKVNILIKDELKGFLFCYHYSVQASVTKFPNIKLGSYFERMELLTNSHAINNKSNETMQFHSLNDVVFFDEFNYIYWFKRFQL
jgi:hypothetical protein